jgi:hypothetical protein
MDASHPHLKDFAGKTRNVYSSASPARARAASLVHSVTHNDGVDLMKVLALIALLALAGCSVKAGSNSDDNGDFNSKLTYNGCTNEYHASSKSELCSKLQDNQDQCGMRYMREDSFKQQCDGQFTPHY